MIYLDHNATAPLDPRALDSMMPYMTDKFGNASSSDHAYGGEAASAVEGAREAVASLVGARPREIVFTSGATESDNLAIRGAMRRYADRGDHMVTCAAEHEAVLETARALEEEGKRVTYVPADEHGHVDAGLLEEAVTEDTVLVSVMAANNEVGTLTDVSKVSGIARAKGALFHTDAAQAAGHVKLDVDRMGIDLMSLSSHKMHGPKGVGALYVRGASPGVRLEPQIRGGGQERGIRSGTSNVPAIVGFGRAASLAFAEMDGENARFREWARFMMGEFSKAGGKLNGHPERRLAGNVSVRFPGTESKAVIAAVSDRVAISAGSACAADTVEPSHVLLAMGLGEEAHSSVRIGMGRFNTFEDIREASGIISGAVGDLKKLGA